MNYQSDDHMQVQVNLCNTDSIARNGVTSALDIVNIESTQTRTIIQFIVSMCALVSIGPHAFIVKLKIAVVK